MTTSSAWTVEQPVGFFPFAGTGVFLTEIASAVVYAYPQVSEDCLAKLREFVDNVGTLLAIGSSVPTAHLLFNAIYYGPSAEVDGKELSRMEQQFSSGGRVLQD